MANADPSESERLTTDHVDHSPAWAPDDQQIVYVYGYGDNQQIRVMNADGSDMRELTSSTGSTASRPGHQADPIAYVAFDGTNANIYVMNANGPGSHRVTSIRPTRMPPPGRPTVVSSRSRAKEGLGDSGISTMSPDGTGVTEWAHDPDPANLGIARSPDGTKAALVSIRGPGNDRNVYVLDVASRELVTLGQPGALRRLMATAPQVGEPLDGLLSLPPSIR